MFSQTTWGSGEVFGQSLVNKLQILVLSALTPRLWSIFLYEYLVSSHRSSLYIVKTRAWFNKNIWSRLKLDFYWDGQGGKRLVSCLFYQNRIIRSSQRGLTAQYCSHNNRLTSCLKFFFYAIKCICLRKLERGLDLGDIGRKDWLKNVTNPISLLFSAIIFFAAAASVHFLFYLKWLYHYF